MKQFFFFVRVHFDRFARFLVSSPSFSVSSWYCPAVSVFVCCMMLKRTFWEKNMQFCDHWSILGIFRL